MAVEGASDGADEGCAPADDVVERVRRALVSFYGVEVGTSTWSYVMSHAMSATDLQREVSTMANPSGFLFRVGRAEIRRRVPSARVAHSFPSTDRLQAAYDGSMVELFDALALLRPRQRAVVLLVKGFGYSILETAAVLELDESAVVDHLRRGLHRLRTRVGAA